MKKERVEIFSDGILAIVITIMVLEMKAPEDTSLNALLPVIPVLLSYVLSFIYLSIYWVNHHHLFQATQKISAAVLWANMHLLFWLSLIPFTTSWMGENHLEATPVALYGFVLLMSAISYRILEITLLKLNKERETFVLIIKKGIKEQGTMILYIAGIVCAYLSVYISIACYIIAALLWIIPNKKIEKELNNPEGKG